MNLAITRLILTFATGSFLFTVLPLLRAEGGRPLLGSLEHDRGAFVYGLYLCAFFSLVLPGFLQVRRNRARWGWVVTVGAILLFSAIPAAFTAFISGVHLRGLMVIGAVALGAAGCALAAHRLAGGRGARVWRVLAFGLLVVIPGLELLWESLGRAFPAGVAAISPVSWLHDVARRHTELVLAPRACLAVGALPWLLVLLPRPRWKSAPVTLGALGLLAGAVLLTPGCGSRSEEAPGLAAPDDRVSALSARLLLGGWFRPGVPTGVRMRAEGGGRCWVRFGDRTHLLPADGVARDLVCTLSSGGDVLRVVGGSGVRVQQPVRRRLPDHVPLVLAVDTARTSLRPDGITVLSLDPERVPTVPGALSAVDAFIVARADASDLPPPVRAAVLSEVRRGATLLFSGTGAERPSRQGRGLVRPLPPGPLTGEAVPLRARPTRIETDLLAAFPRPRWSDVDFTWLILFGICYHVAFLLAFLLPLLIDARKALAVYLWSVSFVTLLVVAVGWTVLRRSFLAENQVHLQRLEVLEVGGASRPGLLRTRWACFASMSAEERTLEFASGERLSFLAPAGFGALADGTPGGLVDARGRARVLSARLNNHEQRLLVRQESTARAPIRVERTQGGAFVLRALPGAEDEAALLTARIASGTLYDGGQPRRKLTVRGRELRPAESVPPRPLGPPAGGSERLLYEILRDRREAALLLRLVPGATGAEEDDAHFLVVDRGRYLWLTLPEGSVDRR